MADGSFELAASRITAIGFASEMRQLFAQESAGSYSGRTGLISVDNSPLSGSDSQTTGPPPVPSPTTFAKPCSRSLLPLRAQMLAAATHAVRFDDLLFALPKGRPATAAQWRAILHEAEASDLAAIAVTHHVRIPFWQQMQASRLRLYRTDDQSLVALGKNLPVAPPPSTTPVPVSPQVSFTGDQTMLVSFRLDDGSCCPGYRRALWTTSVPANATLVVHNSKGALVETLQGGGVDDQTAGLTWITSSNQLAYGQNPAAPGTYTVTLTFVALSNLNKPTSRTVTAQWTAVVT